jgi:hypothetical protein
MWLQRPPGETTDTKSSGSCCCDSIRTGHYWYDTIRREWAECRYQTEVVALTRPDRPEGVLAAGVDAGNALAGLDVPRDDHHLRRVDHRADGLVVRRLERSNPVG